MFRGTRVAIANNKSAFPGPLEFLVQPTEVQMAVLFLGGHLSFMARP